MDDIDRAQEQEHFTRVAAIAAAQHRVPVKTPDNGCCVACGERIEAARVRALGNVETCVACATANERRAAHRRGCA